jgi:hypothetical protein
MSEIVFGAATSHSPMLLIDSSQWREWAERGDHLIDHLADESGVVRSFDDWATLRRQHVEPELVDQVLKAKARRCSLATRELAKRITTAELDALVIVGDDQGEHLDNSNLPPILVYHGDSVPNTLAPSTPESPPLLRAIAEGYYEPSEARAYSVDAQLAGGLIDYLLDAGFDIATSSRLPVDRAEGHAFQYVHRHLTPTGLATVPLMLNTYMPPAQPRARRCVELGRALGDAVRAVAGSKRVGIIASGGLSHFLVVEALDRLVLEACAKGDTEALGRIPESALQSGSSEIKNWMVVAAACSHLPFDLIDYVPGYRTVAGTGTGLAFATWGHQ